jgi:hypothetical protein
MKTSDVYDRYKELCNNDKFICSQSELQEFMLYGLILETGKNKYILRNTEKRDITVLKDLNHNFNLDLRQYINIDLSNYPTNKVYYMSKETYNKYKEQDLIISKGSNEYYRLFAGELWLIQIL